MNNFACRSFRIKREIQAFPKIIPEKILVSNYFARYYKNYFPSSNLIVFINYKHALDIIPKIPKINFVNLQNEIQKP